jgi:mono/diheme cytochrome c family protein
MMKNTASFGGVVVATAIGAMLVLATGGVAHAQDAALVKQGEAVYAAQKCTTCHSVAGKGSKVSPLDGVGAKLSAADIRAWIVDPPSMIAKTKSTKKPPMPSRYAKLPPADIDALVAYLQSLK